MTVVIIERQCFHSSMALEDNSYTSITSTTNKREKDRERERETDRQTDRQTETETETDRQTERQEI